MKSHIKILGRIDDDRQAGSALRFHSRIVPRWPCLDKDLVAHLNRVAKEEVKGCRDREVEVSTGLGEEADRPPMMLSAVSCEGLGEVTVDAAFRRSTRYRPRWREISRPVRTSAIHVCQLGHNSTTANTCRARSGDRGAPMSHRGGHDRAGGWRQLSMTCDFRFAGDRQFGQPRSCSHHPWAVVPTDAR